MAMIDRDYEDDDSIGLVGTYASLVTCVEQEGQSRKSGSESARTGLTRDEILSESSANHMSTSAISKFLPFLAVSAFG